PSGNPSLISECAAQACWDSVVAPLAQQVPVVVGETGDSVTAPLTYLPTFLPWAAANGLTVVGWTWNAWSSPDDVLVTNMQTGTPTAGEGTLFKAWIAGLPLPNPSPSPSPSPSANPSPSPSPSATPSPSPSPSANPSPSPSPSANPTPSPAPSPSPSPSPTPVPANATWADTFESDPLGSAATGWTAAGLNSSWSVQMQGTHALTHSGWTGSI